MHSIESNKLTKKFKEKVAVDAINLQIKKGELFALLSEKTEKKEGLYLARTMLGLEAFLYIIFLVGFPSVRTRILYMAVPWVGILMSGSMSIFITGKLEQKSYNKK